MVINSYGIVHPDGLTPDSDAPMTPEQAAILRDLTERAEEPFDGNLTERQAAERIAYLKERLR